MVHRRRPDSQRGQLCWSYVLDLTDIHRTDLAHEVSALNSRKLAGVEVTVRVGARSPHDVDSRVPYLLANALVGAGVNITLEGHPDEVSAWWSAIDYHRAPMPAWWLPEQQRSRHLTVVTEP